MLAVVALFMVACGLKITKVEFSSQEPMQGDELTMTVSFENNGDNNKDNFYLLYAVRVPSDWAGTALEVLDGDAKPVVNMVPSEAYAKMCEYCYPREGYKWVAFQGEEPVNQSDKHVAKATFTVGEKVGDYNLDVIAGGWKKNPAELLKDGELNLEFAFGNNLDCTNINTDKNDQTGQPATVFHISEYLFNSTTIGKAEYAVREAVLKQTKITVQGTTLPIVPDFANQVEDMDTRVSVKVNPAGIEGVEANDANNAPAEYFDLQGRKVEVPAAGLYIVKRGNNVTKEIVK